MAWIVLVVAGLLEVGWATTLPRTEGFTRPLPTVLFVTLLACSMYGLSVASRTIPIGTAYAVWVGIGAAGAVLVGAGLEQRMLPPAQLLSIAALIAAVIAVKVTAAH